MIHVIGETSMNKERWKIGDVIHYKWIDGTTHTTTIKYVVFNEIKDEYKYLTEKGHSVKQEKIFAGEVK